MVDRARRGYTLFEVVLVMAVLVIVSAFAYPSLKSLFGYHKVNAAVDTVRGAWAMARARAIEEGRPYRFSVEPGGSHFRVAPDQEDYWKGSAPENDTQGKGFVLEHALPAGVQFSLGANGNSNGPEAPASAPPSGGADSNGTGEDKTKASGNWTTGAVFLPNGTARDDVKITFQVRGVRPKTLQLRGLTGTVSVQTGQH
jgi:prepilin-type N-terminal cleavage/methylation domain-containing protein